MSNDIPQDEPSVCIPRIEAHISSEKIQHIFDTVLGAGTVERVDRVPWKMTSGSNQRLFRAFVHMKRWPDTPVAEGMRNRFLEGKEVKLMYDDPWFWRCSRSRVPKPHVRPGPGSVRATSSGPAPELLAQITGDAPLPLEG